MSRNKEDKRARVEAAARALFAERGFEGTTVRAIAERAGVATGTVLLYGESKTELLCSLFVSELTEVVQQASETLPPGSLVDQLEHLLGAFLERYASHPALARVYVKETMFASGSEAAARYESLTLGFIGQLGQVVAARTDLRPGVDAYAVGAASFAIYLLHVVDLLRSDPVDLPRVRASLRSALERLLAGVFLLSPG